MSHGSHHRSAPSPPRPCRAGSLPQSRRWSRTWRCRSCASGCSPSSPRSLPRSRSILACIGLYGVMAYRVARRTREIGIRIAVGASQPSVVWMMVRETLLLVSLGAALGTLASLAANRYIAGQLFGVTPRDPVAIIVALSVLGIVTMLAGYLPARQASRIDPVRALRAE